MATRQSSVLLVALLLCLPSFTASFNPLGLFDGKSITHREITQRAILRKTAEVCQSLAAAEGRDFSLTIDDSLTVFEVQQACSSDGDGLIDSLISTVRFQSSIVDIYLSNAAVDVLLPLSARSHFDDESFEAGRHIITLGVSAIKFSVKWEIYIAGRLILGRICHTLQDFYSHSNWVELGNSVPYSALVRPDQRLENLAGQNTPTCRNCTEESCTDNLLPTGLLTSGYFNLFSSTKPAGKCSHGGSPDKSSRQDPIGGINKDTISSSHGPLHHIAAANLAVDATMELLEEIRVVVGDKRFLLLVGLSQASVLCFVIDTTGSMRDDIDEVKRVSFLIIDSKKGTPQEPSAYILVPFNDPEFGPVMVTTDSDVFKARINELRASGGGDNPEMCLSGLQLALTAAPPSSDIFVFTDAPAKDEHLKSAVTALIESTKTSVTFMLTAVLSSRRRRRTLQQGAPLRFSQTDAQLYRDLARASGGQAIEVTKSDLTQATSVIEDSSAGAVVTVFQAARNPGRPDSFTFEVDGSMRNVTAYITGASSLTFSLTSPTGVSQASTESSGPLGSFSTVGNLRRFRFSADNLTGSWDIRVNSSDRYSLKVIGQSSVNFIYNLVEAHEGAHGDFSLKEGRLLTGGNASLLVTVTGSDTAEVREMSLVQESGSQVNGSVQSLGGGNFLVKFSGLPAGEFVLLLKGGESTTSRSTTPAGNFQRQASTQIKTSSISVTVQTDSTTVKPGSNISIPFTVSTTTNGVVNATGSGSFTMRISNDRSYKSSSPDTISTAEGGQANGTVVLTVPANAASGSDVTLIVEAENTATADSNYALLRLSVVAEVTDVTRPLCTEASVSAAACPSSASLCSTSQWEFSVNITDGVNGTGIESLTVRQGNGTLNTSTFVGAEGENITLATYGASCCSQNVELVAVDGAGNARKCVAQARTTAPETITPAAVVATTSTGGHTLILSQCLWISLAVSFVWM